MNGTDTQILHRVILAIDPGTTESAWCLFNGATGRIEECDIQPNRVLLSKLEDGLPTDDAVIAIEMIASYGMAVGKEVFETCLWIGRFIQAASANDRRADLVYRKDVKMNLCHSMRAKDSNIRQALLDRFPATGGGKTPQIGIAKKPGPLFGVRSHVWSALAVAVTYHDTMRQRSE